MFECESECKINFSLEDYKKNNKFKKNLISEHNFFLLFKQVLEQTAYIFWFFL